MSATQIELGTAAQMQRRPTTAMELLQIALSNNAAIDVIERLAALQEKAEAKRAESDFHEALNRVQMTIGRVAPDLTNPQTHSTYASYAAIDKVIRPIYTREGFSLSFDTDVSPKGEEWVRVLCYVSRGGHTRTHKIDMPADGKGAKGGDVMTKTHATGAADSYGKRYLVKDIFNIAIGEDDKDGNSPKYAELEERIDWIWNCRNIDELQRIFKAAYKEARDVGDQNALKDLIAAKDNKVKDLKRAESR